jgi:hypothetical protein
MIDGDRQRCLGAVRIMAQGDQAEMRRRASLAQTVMEVLDRWGVPPAQQLELLGLPAGTRPRTLIRYRNGEPFPDDETIMRRASGILGINHALQNVYPHSSIAADHWVTSPNPRYNGSTPLSIMLSQGLPGMDRLVDQLSGTGDWG